MKHLVGKKITKKVEFMGDEVEVKKLSVSEVLKIQEVAKTASKDKKESSNLNLIKNVIKIGVVGGDELSDEDFDNFPLDSLSKLVEAVMDYSGLGASDKGN